MIEDRKLSEHYTLYDLTKTNSHPELQEENRKIDLFLLTRAEPLAVLLDLAVCVVGCPLTINSGYRCPALNKAVGSSERSQHLKFEAADCVPMGMSVEDGFKLLWKAVREGRLSVGQLIHETAERSYGVTSWIHISLGEPYRDKARCNQVLRMEHGQYSFL